MIKIVIALIILLFSWNSYAQEFDDIQWRIKDIAFEPESNLAKKALLLSFRYNTEFEAGEYQKALLSLDTMYAIEIQKSNEDEKRLSSFNGRYTECFLKLDVLQRSFESLLYRSEDTDLNIFKPTWQYMKNRYTMREMRVAYVNAFKNVELDSADGIQRYYITFLDHRLYLTDYHLSMAKGKPQKLCSVYRRLMFYELVK